MEGIIRDNSDKTKHHLLNDSGDHISIEPSKSSLNNDQSVRFLPIHSILNKYYYINLK